MQASNIRQDALVRRAIARELPSLLVALTNSGRADWARRAVEPEFVYCFVGGDVIRFESFNGYATRVDPNGAVHAVACVFRNIELLWLEGLHGWDELLRLLRAAPIDDDRFVFGYARVQEAALLHLRRLVSE